MSLQRPAVIGPNPGQPHWVEVETSYYESSTLYAVRGTGRDLLGCHLQWMTDPHRQNVVDLAGLELPLSEVDHYLLLLRETIERRQPAGCVVFPPRSAEAKVALQDERWCATSRVRIERRATVDVIAVSDRLPEQLGCALARLSPQGDQPPVVIELGVSAVADHAALRQVASIVASEPAVCLASRSTDVLCTVRSLGPGRVVSFPSVEDAVQALKMERLGFGPGWASHKDALDA